MRRHQSWILILAAIIHAINAGVLFSRAENSSEVPATQWFDVETASRAENSSEVPATQWFDVETGEVVDATIPSVDRDAKYVISKEKIEIAGYVDDPEHPQKSLWNISSSELDAMPRSLFMEYWTRYARLLKERLPPRYQEDDEVLSYLPRNEHRNAPKM